MSDSLLAILIIASSLSCASGNWANHGRQPISTGMAVMMSGSIPKLFGVGYGQLKERLWTGSRWAWVNHGAPWGLFRGERLVTTPCVLTDGKLFVITSRGRLVERHYNKGWHWAHHNKPPGLDAIRATRCTCTAAHAHRVFVVGNDFKLYERYWSSSSNSWVWRSHGSPQGVSIGTTGIDSCNRPSCRATSVYTTGDNGYLYRLFITASNPGYGQWQNMEKPFGEKVRGVAVGNFGNRIFITTYDNDVCEFVSQTSYNCFGKPVGSENSYTSISISKPVNVNYCNKRPGSSRYIFVYGWDPYYNSRSRFFELRVTGIASKRWTLHGRLDHAYNYIESPESFLSGGCPKVFMTRSSGYVYEFFI